MLALPSLPLHPLHAGWPLLSLGVQKMAGMRETILSVPCWSQVPQAAALDGCVHCLQGERVQASRHGGGTDEARCKLNLTEN